MMTLMPAVHSIISVNKVISVSIDNSTKVFLLPFGYVNWCLRNLFSFSFHSSICLLLFWLLWVIRSNYVEFYGRLFFELSHSPSPPVQYQNEKCQLSNQSSCSINLLIHTKEHLIGCLAFFICTEHWTGVRGTGSSKNTLSDSVIMVCWSRRLALSICWGHLSFALCTSFG